MTNESNEEIERKYTDLFNKLDRGADGELMWRLFTIVMCLKKIPFPGRIDITDLTAELREQGFCESYAEVSVL